MKQLMVLAVEIETDEIDSQILIAVGLGNAWDAFQLLTQQSETTIKQGNVILAPASVEDCLVTP